MITLTAKGNFNNTERFFNKAQNLTLGSILNKYGQLGVNALSAATPKDSGLTAASWSYEIEASGTSAAIYWTNSNLNENVNIAIILQYGHGTGTGGYVQGRDYINPAIRPVFDELADKVWEEVTS